MATHHSDSGDYTYSYPSSVKFVPADPQRQFDLRTEPERMVMWCASLERRFEDLQLRVAYLEMQMHKLVNMKEAQP